MSTPFRRSLSVAALLLLASLRGCGSATSPGGNRDTGGTGVGESAGTAKSSDGVATLDVPARALAQNISIVITSARAAVALLLRQRATRGLLQIGCTRALGHGRNRR